MKQIAELLQQNYRLNIDMPDDIHIYANNDIIICLVVAPHDGTHHRWMIRFSTVTAFDRWANSTAIEEFFETEDKVIQYLRDNQIDIYRQLITYLSMEYEDMERSFE